MEPKKTNVTEETQLKLDIKINRREPNAPKENEQKLEKNKIRRRNSNETEGSKKQKN